MPPALQGASRPLIRALLRQSGMIAHYTFNANRRSAPLYPLFGMKPWPDATHALKLSWIVDTVTILQGRLLREMVGRTSGLISHQTERFMNARLWINRPLILPTNIVVLTDFGDDSPYAAFWASLQCEGRLLADRSPEIMRWRLADPDRTMPSILLGHMSKGRITGYALAQMSKGSSIEPVVLEIVDLMALADAPNAIPTLTRALIQNARSLGAAKVRVQMVSPRMLEQLGSLANRARQEGGWGHAYVRFSDEAMARLWSPTPFDGDYGICLRPVPCGTDVRVTGANPTFAADKASA